MPSPAQALAARRTALGLPTHQMGRTGGLVPVTGDLCTWIETLAVGCGVEWTIIRTLPFLNFGTEEHEIYLRVGPGTGPRLYIAFDRHGRWRHVAGNRHWPGGRSEHWSRRGSNASDEARQLIPIVQYALFPYLSRQADPPAWVLDRIAAEHAQAQAEKAAKNEAYHQHLRTIARAYALDILAERYAHEFDEIVEQQYLVAALEQGSPRVD